MQTTATTLQVFALQCHLPTSLSSILCSASSLIATIDLALPSPRILIESAICNNRNHIRVYISYNKIMLFSISHYLEVQNMTTDRNVTMADLKMPAKGSFKNKTLGLHNWTALRLWHLLWIILWCFIKIYFKSSPLPHFAAYWQQHGWGTCWHWWRTDRMGPHPQW